MKNGFSLWLVALMAILGSFYFLYESEMIMHIVKSDISKLSILITSIFMVYFLRLGFLLKKGISCVKSLDPGYEAADISMALGMLGTVIGFIAMTGSFVGVDTSDPNSVKELFNLATIGMSTALYTTAIGLISSIILRVSHYIVQRSLEKV